MGNERGEMPGSLQASQAGVCCTVAQTTELAAKVQGENQPLESVPGPPYAHWYSHTLNVHRKIKKERKKNFKTGSCPYISHVPSAKNLNDNSIEKLESSHILKEAKAIYTEN